MGYYAAMSQFIPRPRGFPNSQAPEILSKVKPLSPNQPLEELPMPNGGFFLRTSPFEGLSRSHEQALSPLSNDGDGISEEMRRLDRLKKAEEEAKRTMQEPNLTLADLTPYRIKVGYRLAREVARHLGLVADDESLLDGLLPDDDNRTAWETPKPDVWNKTRMQEAKIKPASNAVNVALLSSRKLDPSECPWAEVLVPYDGPRDDTSDPNTSPAEAWAPRFFLGVPLLPPNPPYRFTNRATGETLDGYDPFQDRALLAWVEVMSTAARSLQVENGSQKDPREGRYGLIGLLDPYLCRATFPSPTQIMVWESIVVEEAMNLLTTRGIAMARREMVERHGFHAHEVDQVMKMAKAKAITTAEMSVEEARAIMVLRLEDVIRRSRDLCDVRAELMALKNLALVMGLGKVDPDTTLSDFIQVVADAGRGRFAPGLMPELPEEI